MESSLTEAKEADAVLIRANPPAPLGGNSFYRQDGPSLPEVHTCPSADHLGVS